MAKVSTTTGLLGAGATAGGAATLKATKNQKDVYTYLGLTIIALDFVGVKVLV